MNIKTKLFVIALGLCQSFSVLAERVELKGKVITLGKLPLKNVSIVVKKNQLDVSTSEEGTFSFVCEEKDKITFEAHGFFSKTIKPTDFSTGDSILVTLKSKKGTKGLEEAFDFGHITKSQLNYAIAHLDAGPDFSNYQNILDAIESKIPGVQVSSSSINIRGNSTLNSGPTPALLVVDGTIVEFPVLVNIPPSQIKSIDVLKGAAASARYGSRGMGGVVVVKTKTEN